jgi:hypothetical protein
MEAIIKTEVLSDEEEYSDNADFEREYMVKEQRAAMRKTQETFKVPKAPTPKTTKGKGKMKQPKQSTSEQIPHNQIPRPSNLHGPAPNPKALPQQNNNGVARVYFLGPLPPIPAAVLEAMCARLYMKTIPVTMNFSTLCMFVQDAPADLLPQVSTCEKFVISIVPCSAAWEIMALTMAMPYRHSYSIDHLLAVDYQTTQQTHLITDEGMQVHETVSTVHEPQRAVVPIDKLMAKAHEGCAQAQSFRNAAVRKMLNSDSTKIDDAIQRQMAEEDQETSTVETQQPTSEAQQPQYGYGPPPQYGFSTAMGHNNKEKARKGAQRVFM